MTIKQIAPILYKALLGSQYDPSLVEENLKNSQGNLRQLFSKYINETSNTRKPLEKFPSEIYNDITPQTLQQIPTDVFKGITSDPQAAKELYFEHALLDHNMFNALDSGIALTDPNTPKDPNRDLNNLMNQMTGGDIDSNILSGDPNYDIDFEGQSLDNMNDNELALLWALKDKMLGGGTGGIGAI